MKIIQSRIFENKVKKFSKQEKEILDEEIKKIAENPLIGEEKKGDFREYELLLHQDNVARI